MPGELRALARDLPPNLRMGTSSWAFPGWDGLVYDGAFSTQRLSREGLCAYAAHPLFRTTGIDRTHYAPVEASVFASYAGQVPDDFRFLAKAHEFCTLARFPRHPRYGKNQGESNPFFLDVAYANDRVIAPFMEGLGHKAGPLLFQFAPQPLELLGGPAGFAERLHTFLTALPRGPLYAVEVRNQQLLTKDYARVLLESGASHCINIHPAMPGPLKQWMRTGGARGHALVIRWMLPRHMTYERADKAYDPFNAIVDPDPPALQGIAQLIRSAGALPCHVIVNNKAEGSAPLSIARLAEELVSDEVPF